MTRIGVNFLLDLWPSTASAIEIAAAQTSAPQETNQPEPPAPGLTGSVGVGGQNAPENIKKVQEWLKRTGFDVSATGTLDDRTMRSIETVSRVIANNPVPALTARLEPGSAIVTCLENGRFHNWVQIPAKGTGFRNYNPHKLTWGTALMRDTIAAAGRDYEKNYRKQHPHAALIGVRDISDRNGGNGGHHVKHDHGRHVDIAIPLQEGKHDVRWKLETTVDDPAYDREAVIAMLRAFGKNGNVARIIFWDAWLIDRLQTSQSDKTWAAKLNKELDLHDPKDLRVLTQHKTHFHVELFPVAIGSTPSIAACK